MHRINSVYITCKDNNHKHLEVYSLLTPWSQWSPSAESVFAMSLQQARARVCWQPSYGVRRPAVLKPGHFQNTKNSPTCAMY